MLRFNLTTAFGLRVISVILYSVIIGLQDGIGTDYHTYKDIFSNNPDFYLYSTEPILGLVMKLISLFTEDHKSFFITVSLLLNITIILFLTMITNTEKQFMYCSFIMIFATGLLHNQLNGLRLFLAFYFAAIGCANVLLNKSKVLGILLLLVAFATHNLSIIFVPLIFTNRFIKILDNSRLIVVSALVIIIFFINFVDLFAIFVSYLSPFYGDYFSQDRYKIGAEGISLFTKIVSVSFCILPIFLYRRNSIRESLGNRYNFYMLCLYTSISQLLIYQSFIFNRAAYFGAIMSILPIAFLLEHSRKDWRALFVVTLISIYGIKTVIRPVGEYYFKVSLIN